MRSAKGSIIKLGHGRWRVSVEGPPNEKNGKRTRRGVVCGSRVDATMRLSRLMGEGLPPDTTWELLMDSTDGIEYEVLLLCELGFGMRPEEARALLYEGLYPYELKGTVYCAAKVKKVLTMVSNRPHFKETKNEENARVTVCGEPFASRILELAEGGTGPLVPSGRQYSESEPEAWYTSPVTIAHNWKQ